LGARGQGSELVGDRGTFRFALPLAAVLILLVASLGSAALPARATGAAPAVIGPFAAGATWNGANLSSASTSGSAFVLAQGNTAEVVFTYRGIGAVNVGNATLSLAYLGVVLTTSRAQAHIVGGPPVTGSAVINWTFGALNEALEGVFQLTASLLFTNGSTAWSQTFFVNARAPFDLESGAVVVLLILAIAELYWGLAAIREARKAGGSGRAGSMAGAPAPPTPWTPPQSPPPTGESPPPTGPGGTGGSP